MTSMTINDYCSILEEYKVKVDYESLYLNENQLIMITFIIVRNTEIWYKRNEIKPLHYNYTIAIEIYKLNPIILLYKLILSLLLKSHEIYIYLNYFTHNVKNSFSRWN